MKKLLLSLTALTFSLGAFSQGMFLPDTLNFGDKWVNDSQSEGIDFPVAIMEGPEWEFVSALYITADILQDVSRQCYVDRNVTYLGTHSYSRDEFSITRENEEINVFNEGSVTYKVNFTPWNRRSGTDEGNYGNSGYPKNCDSQIEPVTGTFTRVLRFSIRYVVAIPKVTPRVETFTQEVVLTGRAVPNEITSIFAPIIEEENAYPNPASEFVMVSSNDVRLFTKEGQELDIIISERKIDVSNLQSGMYILEHGAVKEKLFID